MCNTNNLQLKLKICCSQASFPFISNGEVENFVFYAVLYLQLTSLAHHKNNYLGVVKTTFTIKYKFQSVHNVKASSLLCLYFSVKT